MSEKYIDLLTDIAEDTARVSFADQAAIHSALSWLDDHPGQVPGRTITESAFREACEYEDQAHRASSPHTYAERVMFALGITIVPDPEPTNFERLEDLVDQWRKGPHYKTLTQYLDDCGVTAPGGDDDQ